MSKFKKGDILNRKNGTNNEVIVFAVRGHIYTLIDSQKIKYNAIISGIDAVYELKSILESPLYKALS